MKYERLTERNEGDVTINCKQCEYHEKLMICTDYSCIDSLKNRLAELEDKIENGTLVELPCKVGDEIWEIIQSPNGNFINKEIIGDYWITEDGIVARTGLYTTDSIEIEEFGKTVFLTKAEAEKRLEEIKGVRR